MNKFFEKYSKVIYFIIFILFCFNLFLWKEVFYLWQNNNLEVIFLDVGQGDSVFIRTPQNHQILIDGGPTSAVVGKIAKKIPFWDRSLDLVILTHPDLDHMQGLIDIMSKYKVNYILWSGIKKSSPDYLEWLRVLLKQKNMGSQIITAQLGQKIKVENLEVNILHPFENLFGQDFSKLSNETSVVAKLIYGKNSLLFVGDIGFAPEKELVLANRHCQELAGEQVISCIILKSDILKVGHHGSKYSTSEEFLQNVLPQIAVISVGKNSYGHPTQEVLSRLEGVGSQIFRTDQKGDIVFQSDGKNLFLVK